ncbi:MAG: phosphoadenosine phosphosulfate reductase family protein, partial [Planctomycetaceae bacterium]|nr:phosphoadenosine phosphosulfate reductase family protein [Planctomycetaceae bacterium]
FVANEIRPVFVEELEFLQFNQHFKYDKNEKYPLMWAQKNVFWADGEKVAQLNKIEYGKPITAEFFFNRKKKLQPVDILKMLKNKENIEIMDALIFDTLKRIKEMFVQYPNHIPYIAFSGGKDSVVLLDLCHRVLPLNVPVVFSDTDMELPDTYKVWEQIQEKYPDRKFMRVQANKSAIENWQLFGPPSRVLRWCCSVHKSTPAILALRNSLTSTDSKPTSKFLCFVGVRGDESPRRSEYEDIGEGKKNSNQVQAMPILEWSAHELWFYIFQKNLIINEAYRKGNARVGCLFCPLSSGSGRPLVLAEYLYHNAVKPYVDVIINSSNREFNSQKDAEKFVFEGGWFARNNGVYLSEGIEFPSMEINELGVSFFLSKGLFQSVLEWLKTIGHIEKHNDKEWTILSKHDNIGVIVEKKKHGDKLSLFASRGQLDKKFISSVSLLIRKVVGCVACGACEAECRHGAIDFKSKTNIMIDETRCIHCLKCHLPEYGCLRFYSKRITRGKSMNISGVGKYQNFGLQPNWISILSDKRENFRLESPLGPNQVQSAISWFHEAGLIIDGKSLQLTRLLTVAEYLGFDSVLLWQLIWEGLVNNSSLVKWYVCNFPIHIQKDTHELENILSQRVASPATCVAASKSFRNLLKNSPLGTGDLPLVRLELKGNQVKSLTRLPVVPSNLVVLYGLYLMGHLTKRNSFNVREMMSADFEMPCVSPLYAFGVEPSEFQRICNGLSGKYPDFLSVSFTLGLDEVRLNVQKTLDDVLDLVLN